MHCFQQPTRSGIFSCLALAAALMLPLVAAPADAQGRRAQEGNTQDAGPAIEELRIGLQDMKTKEDLGYVVPGEVLTMAPGDSVRLRLVAVPGGQNRAPRYPSAEFSVLAGKESVNISRVNAKEGSAVIDAKQSSSRDCLVRYEVREPMNIRKGLLQGTITVRIEGGVTSGGSTGGGNIVNSGGGEAASANVEAIVDALYQGILMREADPSGANDARDRIRENGYGEIVRRAESMGNSGESRDVDASPSQRLEALYNHLLGKSTRDVDQATLNEDLELLRRGQAGEVAKNLVRSQSFRDRFGFSRSFDRY